MFKFLRPIAPISLIVLLLFLLSACELPRSGAGDIPIPQPQPVTAPPTPISETGTGDEGDIVDDKASAQEAPPENEIEQGSVLVKLVEQAAIQARSVELDSNGIVTAGLPSIDQILQQIGANGLEPVIKKVADVKGESVESFSTQAEGVSQLFVVNFSPEHDPHEVAGLLAQDPIVEYAEPNYIAGIVGSPHSIPAPLTPNDKYFKYQWNFLKIQATKAWDKSTGQGITVAVIDTGIDFGTPDLANANRKGGYNFADNNTNTTDNHSHGTHVAGTIAQNTNNGIGVAGVAYNATLLPIKVLGSNGKGSYEAIIQGIIYAVDQGADVINMSLAGRTGTQAMKDAVKYAYSRGVVVVAAAGNSNGAVQFPAAYDEYVIAVGATTFNNARASYSNFGSQVDIAAPGGSVKVDENGDGYGDGILQQTISSSGSGYSYRFMEGTSMASPHVAGAAALMLSLKPNASPDEIKAAMMQTALNLGPPDQFGAGLLQINNALDAINPSQPPTVTPLPTTPPPVIPTVTPIIPPPVSPTNTPIPIIPTPTSVPPIIPTPTSVPPIIPTPTSVPPIIPTVTPSAGELLLNGNFETDGGWVFGDTPILASYDTAIILSGSRSVLLGSVNVDKFSYSSIWQQITIPTEAKQATLTANIYPISQDSAGSNVQRIMILDANFQWKKTLMWELSNKQAWETRTYDLSEFKGQTIYVYLSVFNRGQTNRPTAMYIDDISLQWTP